MGKTNAPQPGVSRRAARTARAQEILILRLGDREWRLAWRNLPLAERLLVRRWTGLTIEAFLGGPSTVDADSLALLWCLARRAAGELQLQFSEDVVDQWSELLESTDDELEVLVETPDDDSGDVEHPEA